MKGKKYETVHHPPHYLSGDIEHCEYVEACGKADGYYFGQVTKYLHRAGSKPGADELEDLRKAHWYMARWVAWKKYGKKIWKIVRRDPDVVFDPNAIVRELTRGECKDKVLF